MDKEFINKLFNTHKKIEPLPAHTAICKFTEGLLELLFPQLSEKQFKNSAELEVYSERLINDLKIIILSIQSYLDKSPDQILKSFFKKIPDIYDMLLEDAQSIHEGDPAAKGRDQVIRTYPGFLAIACYRIGHVR